MDFKRKLFPIITLIVVLPLSVITSNVSIVDAQSFVVPEEKPTISTTGSAEKEIPSDESQNFFGGRKYQCKSQYS